MSKNLEYHISTLKSVYELAVLLFIKFEVISSRYPEVLIALTLFLTLPVTVASAERSFSTLKIIKSYLSTVGQDRLNNLGMIDMNHSKASEIDKKELIKRFSERKSRERFLYKIYLKYKMFNFYLMIM